jgi:hypothetical protein
LDILVFYIIFGILAITGFALACMGFRNEQSKDDPEWKSMPLICISFSISEFAAISIPIIQIIKRIKKWILAVVEVAFFDLIFFLSWILRWIF